jgi:hypothetical protein
MALTFGPRGQRAGKPADYWDPWVKRRVQSLNKPAYHHKYRLRTVA